MHISTLPLGKNNPLKALASNLIVENRRGNKK